MHSSSQQGFALIATILSMALILALGLGALFMSEQNLKVNENAQSKALAKANAEAGLDAARIVLAEYYDTHNAYPSNSYFASNPLSFSSSEGSMTFTITEFTVDPGNADRAYLKVIGTGPRDAKHTAETLLDASSATGGVDPLFYRGLIAKGVVTNSGGIAPLIDADVHGDLGYKLEAGFQSCAARDPVTGTCTAGTPLVAAFPLSAASGISSYECSVKPATVDPCVGGTPQTLVDPVNIVTPPYAAIRDAAEFNGRPISDYLSDPSLCTYSSLPSSVPPNTVVCASGEVDISGVTIGDPTLILTDGKIKSGGGATLDGVTLVSTANEISMSGGNDLDNVRLFAETKLTLSGGTTVGGKSTIASGGSVTMSGGTEALNPYTSGGKTSVGIAIIGVGDVTLSGGSVYYGSVWGGGDVTMSGGTSIFGGVATMGDITLTGGAFVDANVIVDNDELPQTAGRGVTSLSRR